MNETGPETPTPIIDVQDVHKSFGAIRALEKISLAIMPGEFFTLVGPSGCGKTTLLRIIAGFEDPTRGCLYINGQPMDRVPANRRPTNMVFQNYAVFPHMNVSENISYGLRTRKLDKQAIRKTVREALEMVGLSGFENRSSQALSGGQKQRVALARALVMKPKVLLLDEPLSALDKKLREQMQSELRHLQRAVGITFVLVTHDQEEALTMSDRIAVMFDGRIAQVSQPQVLYRRPVNKRVAEFVGVMNFLDAREILESKFGYSVDIEALGRVDVPREQVPDGIGSEPTIGIRPEMLTILSDSSQKAERETMATVVEAQYFGDMTYYDVRLEGTDKCVTISMRNTSGRSELNAGAKARIGWSTDSIIVLH